jgi:hypothetical protein
MISYGRLGSRRGAENRRRGGLQAEITWKEEVQLQVRRGGRGSMEVIIQ